MWLSLASETQLVGSLCKRHAVTHVGAPTACKRTVSGSIALRCSRFFSPFPHGTGPLSVSQECLALADGAARFRQGSSGPALLRIRICIGSISNTRLSRSTAHLSRCVLLSSRSQCLRPTTPAAPQRRRFGLLRVRSPLLAESLLFSLPAGT